MKTYFTLILLLSCWVPSFSQSEEVPSLEENFSWILGDWKRTNGDVKNTTRESWEKVSSLEWKGVGLTTQGTDTVFMEHMQLTIQQGEHYLNINTFQSDDITSFKITQFDDVSFVAENPANEFPKKIFYRKTDRGIKATISGGGKTIDFVFEKLVD